MTERQLKANTESRRATESLLERHDWQATHGGGVDIVSGGGEGGARVLRAEPHLQQLHERAAELDAARLVRVHVPGRTVTVD